MQILKVLRIFVLLISFVMFCYQFHTATVNLMDPPTVLSQYERDATDADMPLVTVCPTNQINLTKIKNLGYGSYDDILTGIVEKNELEWFTSWGDHRNLTFEELKEQAFDLIKVKYNLLINEEYLKDNPVFIPGYGLCMEASFLNYTQEIKLMNHNEDDSRVFVTPVVTEAFSWQIFLLT